MFSAFGKIFIIFGIFLIVIGIITLLGDKLIPNNHLFRLPGDIFIKKGNFTFYFPVVTCIIISIILTILLNIFFRK
jgi:membrane protein implicated in regulation of membrane protease activity